MPRGNQLARQWQLLQLIDSPAGIAVDGAARKLNCTVRTIWRDLQVLQNAGFPLYDDKGADGRRSLWRLEEGFKQSLPVKLSLAETAALLMSRDLLRPFGAEALGVSVMTAFEKIGRVLSQDARRLLDQMRDTIGVRPVGAKLQAPAAEHVILIQKALLDRCRLEMHYYSMSRDEEDRRQVDPYHLTVFDGGFYMVGYCHLRRAERIFAVERIRQLKSLAVHFDVRPGFDAEEYLRHSLGIVKGEVVTVRAAFSKSIGRYIRDRLWHSSQKFRDMPDGRLELTLRVADTLEVRRWLLGYGPEVEVLEPLGLRQFLQHQAEAVVRKLAASRKALAPMPSLRLSKRRLGGKGVSSPA